MKNILKAILASFVFVSMLALGFVFQDTIRSHLIAFVDEVSFKLGIRDVPCEKPIPYTLGTFDGRFNISEKYFLDALLEAENIWEKSFGKELFVYEPQNKEEDTLKINLVYDYRQEATTKLSSLGTVLKDNQSSYNELKNKFSDLKNQLERDRRTYDTQLQNFNEQKSTYEEKVRYWNSKGGAPKAEYEKLQKEKSSLDYQVLALQTLQNKINKTVEEINSLVVVLNRLATTLNISVEKYNTIGASRGESFEEGLYSYDGSSSKIDIYEFSNRSKLVRVLAHEFGHALGLDHVVDPEAIMYELNQGSNLKLTDDDLEALQKMCGVK